ncbi:prevent-host-death protein [Nocardia bovistercoris]|uniref:Prevent-host-death protein n=1 Tax=Nocardia bovistercoris TaxID=2785916 RepID=A0A931N1X7_9NOCA|nr:prevent-host-death protein [Nocardia bovistercoris]MBH0775416.1 prevent-host-death protein [Nocardia bovistercoris]
MTIVDSITSVTRYDSMHNARNNFSQMLTAAEEGNLAVVSRKGKDSALVQVGRLRLLLAHIIEPHEAQVVREDGRWVAYLPGLPLAVEESDFDTAIAALIEAMREYAADWQDHLHAAVNHRDKVDFVQFVELSTDEQLREWLTAAER